MRFSASNLFLLTILSTFPEVVFTHMLESICTKAIVISLHYSRYRLVILFYLSGAWGLSVAIPGDEVDFAFPDEEV